MKKKEKNIICFDVLCQVFIFLVVFVRTGAGGQLGFRVEAFLLSLDWQSSHTHTHARTHARTHTHTHKHTHTNTHTHKHTHTHTNTHTHTHAHTHTHTALYKPLDNLITYVTLVENFLGLVRHDSRIGAHSKPAVQCQKISM